MSTHIEWADAGMSKVACLSALEVDPYAKDDDSPVLVMGTFGDTVMAFTGSMDEMTNLLVDALNAIKLYERSSCLSTPAEDVDGCPSQMGA